MIYLIFAAWFLTLVYVACVFADTPAEKMTILLTAIIGPYIFLLSIVVKVFCAEKVKWDHNKWLGDVQRRKLARITAEERKP